MKATGNYLQAAAENIMERFDFENTRRVMELLKWYWATARGIPDETQLRGTADQLLQGVIKHWLETGEGTSWATGGFEARVSNCENSEPQLQLLFYVDCRHSDGSWNG